MILERVDDANAVYLFRGSVELAQESIVFDRGGQENQIPHPVGVCERLDCLKHDTRAKRVGREGQRGREAKVVANELTEHRSALFSFASLPYVVDENGQHAVSWPEYSDEDGLCAELQLRLPLGQTLGSVFAIDVVSVRHQEDVTAANVVQKGVCVSVELRAVAHLQCADGAAASPGAKIEKPVHGLTVSPIAQPWRQY